MSNEDTHRSIDGDEESHLSTDRRRFLQAAGVGAAGLTAFGGFTAAQSGAENTFVLEAVTVGTGGNGGGRSEYVWEDGTGGVARGPPEAVCDAVGGDHVWTGVSPGAIEDVTNPTLSLTAGEEYTIEWTNVDGDEHSVVIVDEGGSQIVSSDSRSTAGETHTFEFTASEDMAEYYCGTHSTSQRGGIDVETRSTFEAQGTEPVEVVGEDGPVARYMHAFDEGDFYSTYKTFLNVVDPTNGELLTADPDQNTQFPHHRGLFIGWDNVTVDGDVYDFWHMDDDERMVHESFDGSLNDVSDTQTLRSINRWNTSADGETVIEETRELTFAEPQMEEGIVQIDMVSTLEATASSDVALLGDPEHAGIQYRPHDDVAQNTSAEYIFPADAFDSEDPSNGDINSNAGLSWAVQTHDIRGEQFVVQHMNHPTNPAGTVYSAYRDYGRFGTFFEETLAPGETLTIGYRIIVKRGDAPSQSELASYYEDFAATGLPGETIEEPPSVSPNEIGMGASPSSDATVLWDGEDATLDQWHHRGGDPVEWTDEGEYFQVNGGTGDILSDAELGDCHLHLEWRAPEDVSGEGQSRNNSGVKMMDRYEFQILDNYENSTYADGWAGAYYGQAPPLVSPLRPPGEWQSYDVIWRAPQFDDDGNLTRPAQASLLVNGVVVIAHLNIDGISGGTIEPYEAHPPEAPVMLQDHQSDAPPQFRNVWFRPLADEPVAAGATDLPDYDTTAGSGQPPAVSPTGPATEGSPPSDAEVLLGGDSLDGWEAVGGGAPGWTVGDGYVEVAPGEGGVQTEDSFGDSQIHLEWKIPEGVEGAGLNRGNSGLLMLGQYQIQLLDNDGNPVDPVAWAGSFPDQAAPEVSPIEGPGEWQRLDVVWQGPRFDGGTLEQPAQVTVLLNETVVQSRLVVDGPNPGGIVRPYESHPPDGPIRLEDGGDPVQFRNLWQRPLDPADTDDEERLSAPYGLNAGGVSPGRTDLSPDDTVEVDGVPFEPHTESIQPHPAVTLISDHNGSSSNGLAHEIEGTDADSIYQTMMWSTDSMGYEIAMEPGTYDVTFHLAEIHFNVDEGAPNPGPDQERTFSGYVQGEPVFEELETWDSPLQAMTRTVEGVQVEDEPLVIELESSVENPMVNAIEIRESAVPENPVSVPYGLNAGGVSSGREDRSPGDAVEVGGVEFEPYTADVDPHPGVTLVGDHNESGASGDAQEIAETDADAIYQTMMFGSDIGYEIDVEPGAYAVTLHLAEIYWGEDAPGGVPDTSSERIYSASVQGQQAFEELHLMEEVAELVAYPVTVEVVVEEGESLVIESETVSDNSMFNAIEIRDSDAYVPENPVSTPYGLNAGGVSSGRADLSPGDTVEIDGIEYEPYTDAIDPHEGVTLVSQHNTSGANGDAQAIAETDADAIYQTMMWSEDEMGYEIELQPGTYDVTFHLAEIFYGEDAASGGPPDPERIYSAWANGEPVFEDLNLWADSGELTAQQFTIEGVSVEDGPMEIELESSSENPMVNGLEIRDADDPRPAEQHLWLASDHEAGDQPDGWAPQAHVEDWAVDEDDDGVYLGLSGADGERTSLRFTEATEATEMEVWAIAKAADPDGDYWVYSRGSGEDAPGSELTAPRADDYIAEDAFRLSAYDSGDLTTGETVDHVGVDELYQVRLQVSGDTMRARWWPLDAAEPDEWDLEGEAPAEEFGYPGIGHWSGGAYRLYAFGVGVDGAEAPSTIPDDIGGAYVGNPAVPPEEALATFDVPDGWTIEQVAAEPLIDNPVDVKWDARGRMWVVEMPDFMDLVPGDGRGGDPPGNYGDWGGAELSEEEMTGWGDELTDAEPNGAVKILEDTDGDGVVDEVTAFADDLTMSRSLSVLGDGSEALVAHAGSSVESADLFLASDDDGDSEADSTESVKSSWVSDNNPEHTSNGLDYNLNNWLYSANSGDRFRYRDGDLEEGSTHGRGQWGIAQDDYGRLYSTTNSYWLYADLVPGNGQYLLRGSSSGSAGVDAGVAPDGTVYPVREGYGTNRSYTDMHRDDGRLSQITAISGPGIYRGDVFPEEHRNDAFVPEPAANAVGHFAIEDEPGGLGLDVSHEVYDNAEWGEQDFIASSDEVFRPVNVTTGPDGALYVVDMYQGVLQHNFFLTDYLAEYAIEDNLHLVPPAGRIYRIYPEGAELDDPPSLAGLSADELAGELEDGNGWVRKTAQRLIVQGQLSDAAPALRDVARESDDAMARMHALWALDGLDEVDAESVFAVMDDVDDTHVQAAAMQTGEALLGTGDADAYVDRLVDYADADHLRLVVQAAYSLGEVADADLQDGTARPALEDLLDEYGGNSYVEEAVSSSPEMSFG